jgi:two-component system alkaline phosphatase synthesis response regulator PhoP
VRLEYNLVQERNSPPVDRTEMPASRILVVEDDLDTAKTVKLYLEHAGFEASVAADGTAALEAHRAFRPDLVILDRMLPGVDGLEVCRQLRRQGDVPIIILTARTTEPDRLEGLQLGADDYVVKPFSPRELVARVQAVLRRTGVRTSEKSSAFGRLEIAADRAEVRIDGQLVSLTATEHKLLDALCSAPGLVLSRSQLVERVFGWDYEGSERTIDVHIANLRRKLEGDPSNPQLVVTVFGMGYKFAGGRIEY